MIHQHSNGENARVRTWIVCYLLFLIALFPSYLAAEQTVFNKQLLSDDVIYQYEWIDAEQNSQSFSFTLDAFKISNQFRHFKALRPSLLNMYSVKKLQQAASTLDPRKGKVKIMPTGDGVEYKISSMNRNWQSETMELLRDVYHSSLKEYLHQEYYVEFNGISNVKSRQPNTIYFKPDHKRFVNEGFDATAPIISKLKERFPNSTARQIAEFLIGWIQTIPYDDLERRETSNGAGFEPPIHLINKNRGDCDSKVTLIAHLLKQIFPRLRMAIIYLPEHALIGLNVSVLKNDEVLEIDGLKFVLAEPVGPAVMKIANVHQKSKQFIDSGLYQVEKLY
jgi:hypothetical protein